VGGSNIAMSRGRRVEHRSDQVGLLVECLIWALIVAAVYSGIATVSDWQRFEPEAFADYRDIVLDRWSFVPDYLVWIGLPLGAFVWLYSRWAAARRSPIHEGGDEDQIVGRESNSRQSPIETFVWLYLAAMIVAGLARTAIVRCGMHGECDFFIWYQGVLYSAVFLMWPLLLLLLRHAIWKVIRPG
jgi:hypothetical protein